MEKEDPNLDMTAMETAIIPSGSVALHPFRMGFRQAVAQMRDRASTAWGTVARWVNPAPFLTSPDVRHTGNLRSDADRSIRSASVPSSPLAAEAIDRDRDVREGVNPTRDSESRPSYGMQETRTHKVRGGVDSEDRRTTASTSMENSSERSGILSYRTPVTEREASPAVADTRNPSLALKMSHSRVEDTDIVLDAALLASGMGGVWVLEHLADLAIHTRLKPSTTAQRYRIAAPGSPHPSNGREPERLKEGQSGSRPLNSGDSPDGSLKADTGLSARPSVSSFRR